MQQQLIQRDACESIDTEVATDRAKSIQTYQSTSEHDCHEKTLKTQWIAVDCVSSVEKKGDTGVLGGRPPTLYDFRDFCQNLKGTLTLIRTVFH